jgi:hypothetical protein
MRKLLAIVLALLNAGAFAEPPSFVITQRGAAVHDFEYVWSLLQRATLAELVAAGLSEEQAKSALDAVPAASEAMKQQFMTVQLQACNNKDALIASKRDLAALLESSEADSDGIRRDAVDALLTSLGPELAAELTARSRAESSIVIARVDHDKYLDMVDAAHVRWMVESLCYAQEAR